MSGLRWVVNLAVLAFWLRMMWAVGARPASRWALGWTGKALTFGVVALFNLTLVGFWLPLGPVLVGRWLRRHTDPLDLPMADGRRGR